MVLIAMQSRSLQQWRQKCESHDRDHGSDRIDPDVCDGDAVEALPIRSWRTACMTGGK